MEKEDIKVLIHAGLALVVIFGGFVLIELYGKPVITSGAIGHPQESKEIQCIQVTKVGHKGVYSKESCCRMMEKASNCQELDGVMELGFDIDKKTRQPAGLHKVEYLCINPLGIDENRLYFNFDTYNYCELSGYYVAINQAS